MLEARIDGQLDAPVAVRQLVPAASARETSDKSIAVFSKNGLFRADCISDHYEAITGQDDLL